jgi:hypothetical protein
MDKPKSLDHALAVLKSAYDSETLRGELAAAIPSASSADAARAEQEAGAVVRIAEFLAGDATAQAKLRAAINRPSFVNAFVDLGRRHGITVSAVAVEHALSGFAAANDGELSDAQLEAVAGGGQTLQNWGELFSRLPPNAKP